MLPKRRLRFRSTGNGQRIRFLMDLMDGAAMIGPTECSKGRLLYQITDFCWERWGGVVMGLQRSANFVSRSDKGRVCASLPFFSGSPCAVSKYLFSGRVVLKMNLQFLGYQPPSIV